MNITNDNDNRFHYSLSFALTDVDSFQLNKKEWPCI